MSFDNVFDCGKCFGKGKIEAFRRYANGDCFDCRGTGKIGLRNLPKSAQASLSYSKGWLSYPNNGKAVKTFHDALYLIISYSNGAVDSELIADLTKTEDRTEFRNLWANWKGEKTVKIY